MHTQRLGCLSGMGLMASLFTLLAVVAIGLFRGGSLFSPGPLSVQAAGRPLGGVFSHAELDGNCAACHPAFWEADTMADRCQDCHAGLFEDPASLHSLIMSGDPTCRRCHPEHRGPQAALTLLDTAGFPHRAVGYDLAGHRTTADGTDFACEDCHANGLNSFDPFACLDCHDRAEDTYRTAHHPEAGLPVAATGEPACLDCHDGVDRYGAGFDHDQLAFPLLGGHAEAACSACHAGAATPAELQAAPRACFDCHAEDDAHAGRFGQLCGACHTAQDWEQVEFDHSQTAFPLDGRHAGLDCEDCHANQVYTGTPSECAACHAEDDVHAGEFGRDCAGCHTAVDWKPATFDHSLSAFPLTGAHQEVACQDCHQDRVYAGTPVACEACHADPVYHLGLFAGNCEACHTTAAWQPARYDDPHTFPIDHGENGPSSCRVCHPDSLQAYTCYGCHEHTPGGVEAEHREEGIRDFQDCMRCHPTGREEEGERDDD